MLEKKWVSIWLKWTATLKLGMALRYVWTTGNLSSPIQHLFNPVCLNTVLLLCIRKDWCFV